MRTTETTDLGISFDVVARLGMDITDPVAQCRVLSAFDHVVPLVIIAIGTDLPKLFIPMTIRQTQELAETLMRAVEQCRKEEN